MLSNRRVFFNTWIEVQLIFPPLDYLARGIARNTNKNSLNGVKPVRKHFYIVWNVCRLHSLTAWERLAFQTIFTDKKLPICLITDRSLNFLKKTRSYLSSPLKIFIASIISLLSSLLAWRHSVQCEICGRCTCCVNESSFAWPLPAFRHRTLSTVKAWKSVVQGKTFSETVA